jgi:UDP-N-acetylglucosamine transferase subunit ALG13
MVNSRKYLSDILSLSLAHSFSCRPRILVVRLTLAIFPYHCLPTSLPADHQLQGRIAAELIEIDVVAIINEQARGVRTAKEILYARTSVPLPTRICPTVWTSTIGVSRSARL